MDAKTARTTNIRAWVDAAGGPTGFVAQFGAGTTWTQAQVSQWISATNPKGIGHALARTIEKQVRKPAGSMDRPPESQAAGLDKGKLESATQFLEQLFDSKDRQFVASLNVDLITAVYADLLETSAPNWPWLYAIPPLFSVGWIVWDSRRQARLRPGNTPSEK